MGTALLQLHLAEQSDQAALLTRVAHEQGWLADDVDVTRLTPAGAGNMNVVLRGLHSDGTTLIYKQAVPFVARYPDIPAPVERGAFEARYYQALASSPCARGVPRFIGFAADHNLLCMEDLGQAADCTDLYETPERYRTLPDYLPELVEWLEHLHGIPVPDTAPFTNLSMRELNHQHIFEIPFQPDNGLDIAPELSATANQLIDQRLLRTIGELGSIYLAEQDNASLLHGDFYPGSWLQTESGIKIIDPEFGFCGNAEFDLAVLYAHLVMAACEPTEIEQVVARYQSARDVDSGLVRAFAGVEILRRLLGVAQLPLSASVSRRCEWVTVAKDLLANG